MGPLVTVLSVILLVTGLYPYNILSRKSDLTFLIDTTGAISQRQFEQVIDFVYNITSRLTIGPDNTMVAVVTFNTDPVTHFDLDDYNDKTSVLNSISDLKSVILSGKRNTHSALKHVAENIYSDVGGQRTNADSSDLVLIMYGVSELIQKTLFALDDFQGTRYAVGVGSFVLDSTKNGELSEIATDNEKGFYIEEFSYLCNYMSNVTVRLDPNIAAFEVNNCPEITTTSTTTSTTTTTTTTTSTTIIQTTVEATTEDLTNSTGEFTIDKSKNDIIIISSVLFLVIVAIVTVLIVMYYLPKYRKQRRLEQIINLLVSEYPNIENGLGPTKRKYEEKKDITTNGHHSVFHTYLKLSMLNNGSRTVTR